MIRLDRRRALISTAEPAVVGGMATARLLPEEMLLRDRRPAVAGGDRLSRWGLRGFRRFTHGRYACGSNGRGKSVLLKPNFVEYIAGIEVNTDPML
jgi:hypothetical protein